MDFKVAGTKKGITAIQMDLKNDGLTMEIIKNALDITYDARCEILDQIMLPCISEPRKEVSKYAPKMIIMHINPDNIRDVIGKGGSVIQKIVADTGAKIDIDDDGTIHIAAADASACDAAKKLSLIHISWPPHRRTGGTGRFRQPGCCASSSGGTWCRQPR